MGDKVNHCPHTYLTYKYISLYSVKLCNREYLSKCYNFTEFAVTLNEPEEDVAPTDSRRRPDQRLMEEGKWEEANKIKAELEMIQRAARKELELQVEGLRIYSNI